MSRFSDSVSSVTSVIDIPSSSKDDKIVVENNDDMTQVSFMGAITQPIQDGKSMSIDATIEKKNDIKTLTYMHPILGWCVNFIPSDGVISQMSQLQKFREDFPTEAKELCMKCEKLIQISTIGDLNEFREMCGNIINIPSWGKPPPLW